MPIQKSHLRRLAIVFQPDPVFLITTCTHERRPILANAAIHQVLRREWSGLRRRHGWAAGRYVVMPDHVHFLVRPAGRPERPLATAVGKWKEWTARGMARLGVARSPVWQPEFFDHLIRSEESLEEKWRYVQENPVRAGLVERAEDWPWSGAIDFEV